MALKKAAPKAKEEIVEVEEVKKAPAKKTTTRRTSAKKTETVIEVYIEHNGVQVPLKEVIENVKTSNVKAAKEIKIYLKPEDNAAYYVADGKEDSIKVYFC